VKGFEAMRLSKLLAIILLGSAMAAPALISVEAATAKKPKAAPVQKEATTGQEAVHKVCDGCHNTEIVMDTPKDYDEWHDTIQDMIDRGARGTPHEFDLVMQYIYENMTTVNVNNGIADDLKVVLGANDQQVDEIVAHRVKTPFKDLDDLLATVPGLDGPALKAKSRMIYFKTL
jgi:DNA uptake protein ComE-like DNA-binding protein